MASVKSPKLTISPEAKPLLLADERRFGTCLAAHVKRAVATHEAFGTRAYESTCRVDAAVVLRMKTVVPKAETWVGLDWQTPRLR